ncbi:zinc ribbon domain-containing protein [Limosilactobacillus sp.]|uniref:zinc ribbon domain-containing protein n=1 Tax=Limosilactobacillus sp. TaxID=2773925 RepID=UPI003F0CDA6A
MKTCPNCGKPVVATAKFCPHCGHELPSGQGGQKKGNHRRRVWLTVILLLVLLVAGGGIAHYLITSQEENAADRATSNSQPTHNNAYSAASSASSASTEPADSGDQLATDLGPKGTAAAITTYAIKNNFDGWSAATSGQNLQVLLSDDDDLLDSLADTGMGMAYVVSSGTDSDNGTVRAYTLDKDETVNIYSLPVDYADSDKVYQPVKRIAKGELIQYLNTHHAASEAEELQGKVVLQHGDD